MYTALEKEIIALYYSDLKFQKKITKKIDDLVLNNATDDKIIKEISTLLKNKTDFKKIAQIIMKNYVYGINEYLK